MINFMRKAEKKYMERNMLDKCVKKYSNLNCDRFGNAVEKLLEENHISKTDLSKIIGVDNQCLTNWTSPSIQKPKWLNVMYRMNLFFHDYDKSFSSICLFDEKYQSEVLDQQNELEQERQKLKKQKLVQDKELQRINYKKSILTMIDKLESNFAINIEHLLYDLYSLLQYKKMSCKEQTDKHIELYNRKKYNDNIDVFISKYMKKF